MALRLQGKLALITAAGQGIGRAIAEAFAVEGARVIATDLEEKKLEGIKSVKRRKLDVRSTAAIESRSTAATSKSSRSARAAIRSRSRVNSSASLPDRNILTSSTCSP